MVLGRCSDSSFILPVFADLSFAAVAREISLWRDREATIITAPVGWCKPGAAAFDDPDIAALSVRLWNPVVGDKLSLLTAAGEAAQAILL